MSAPMPEVVWVELGGKPNSTQYWVLSNPTTGTPYVPESRLLAAEARAKAMEDGPLDYMSGKCDRLKEQNAALRADLDALVPLARLGLGGLDGGSYYLDYLVRLGVSKPTGAETPATTQARAILAREET